MTLKLVRLNGYSGKKATIYTVQKSENKSNPFQTFIKTNSPLFDDKLINFINRIRSMANHTGVLEEFFKLGENENKGEGENVCALYDEPKKEMRLFCIRISEKILVLGGGGPKPPNIHKWQEDKILTEAARYMISISEIIKTNINKGRLYYSEDGMFFSGNLNIL